MLQKLARCFRSLPVSCIFAVVIAGATPLAAGASFQTSQAADVVLGQPDFISSGFVYSPSGMTSPDGIAMDPATGKVFVVERSSSRVLRFSSAAAALSGSSAEAVFGQPNFTSHSANQGGTISATTFSGPVDVSVDSVGRLWVADAGNNRVLGFYLASYLGNDPAADFVLGQPNFISGASGLTAATMNVPYGVSSGPNDVLWVADLSNSRVLRFDNVTAKTNPATATADGVLGQTLFTTSAAALTATGLNNPGGLYADADGRLWVADTSNSRVLRYDAAATKANGAAADGVLGEPDFTTASAGTSATSLNGPYGIYLDPSGGLWVSEYYNSRVTHFSGAASLPNGTAADLVLGQPDFSTSGFGVTAQKLDGPGHIGAGPGGSLFVADYINNRVLRFSPIVGTTPTPAAAPAPVVVLRGKHALVTSKGTASLSGTASDQNGTLARVEVKVGSAGYKAAAGTTAWKFTAKLKVGKNLLLVRAVDVSGVSSAPLKVTVTRR